MSHTDRKHHQKRRPRWTRILIFVFFLLASVIAVVFIGELNAAKNNARDVTAQQAESPSPLPTPSAEATLSPANAGLTASPSVSPEATQTPALQTPALPTPTPGMSPAPSVSPKSSEALSTPLPSASPGKTSGELPEALKGLSLSQYKSEQIVVVEASGTKATVTLYTKNSKGGYDAAVSAKGSVGKSGVSTNRKEGDGSTPAGIYRLGFAFGNKKNPGTKLEYRDVTSQSYWVDDSDSNYYNQWVEGTKNKDWDSVEALAQAPTAYAYAIVVEYNYGKNAVPGKGSAIFLHCGTKPTVGCIDIPENDLVKMLKLLDKQKNPIIVILDS